MENIVIQSNANCFLSLDDFIRRLCIVNNIDSYYALMSVPIMEAVRFVIDHHSNTNISLQFKRCTTNALFTMVCDCSCFNQFDITPHSLDAKAGKCHLLLTTLVDKVKVMNEGRVLQLYFDVFGISRAEVARRISVLNNFYAASNIERQPKSFALSLSGSII